MCFRIKSSVSVIYPYDGWLLTSSVDRVLDLPFNYPWCFTKVLKDSTKDSWACHWSLMDSSSYFNCFTSINTDLGKQPIKISWTHPSTMPLGNNRLFLTTVELPMTQDTWMCLQALFDFFFFHHFICWSALRSTINWRRWQKLTELLLVILLRTLLLNITLW